MIRQLVMAGLMVAGSAVSAAALGECGSGRWPDACVIDGDTLWLGGQRLRAVGYDAPETRQNICGGAQEVALGRAATARLVQILNGGGIELRLVGHDRYGRGLVVISTRGRDVADILVSEGLARRYPKGREFWCR